LRRSHRRIRSATRAATFATSSHDGARPSWKASDKPIRLVPGTRLDLTLRPETAVTGAVAVRAVLSRDGRVQRWDAPAEIQPDGVVRIVAPRDTAFPGVAPGPWELIVAVGRHDDLPSTPEALDRAPARVEARARAYHVARVRLLLDDGEQKPPPRVEIAGCGAVRRGPVCEIAGRAALRFAIRGTGPVSVHVDGAPRAERAAEERGFRKLRIELPAGAREVAITEAGSAPFILPLAPKPGARAPRVTVGRSPDLPQTRHEPPRGHRALNRPARHRPSKGGAAAEHRHRDGTASTRRRVLPEEGRRDRCAHGGAMTCPRRDMNRPAVTAL
jgi:hypothetical protein